MLRSVLTKSVRDERRALLWWGVGTGALAFWITFIYPSYSKSAAGIEEFWKQAPEALRAFFGDVFDLATAEGFLQAEIFSLMAPLIFAIYAIGAGSKAIAGEEGARTLDVLLAGPISRRRIVIEKFGSMIVATSAIAVVLAAALLAGGAVVGMGLDPVRLTTGTFFAALLGLTYGSIAFALGAATGERGRSVGIATAFAIATYILNGLAPLISWLHPWRWLSPFHYFLRDPVLKEGVDPLGAAVLGCTVVAMLCVATWTFDRRDVGT